MNNDLMFEPKPNSSTTDAELSSAPACTKPTVMGSTENIGVIEGINRVHHLNFLNNTLPDKCANLIIADPPYFEVKGAFDFIWEDMKAYLLDVEKWAKECKRLLADNGTLFWFGDAKNIAYAQVIFDEHFTLLNNLVWENTNQAKQSMVNVSGYRSFPPLTERILMYSSSVYGSSDREFIEQEYISHRNPFSIEIKKGMDKYDLREIDFRKLKPSKNGNLTGWCSNIILGSSNPTKEDWILIEGIIKSGKCYNDLKFEYELLRAEYELLRRPFENFRKFGDVIRLPNYETCDHDHDTVKPEELQRTLIMTCSRKNDLVIVPFAGSGTEMAMSIKEGRRAIGFEITEKHVHMSNRRVQDILRKPELFQ